MALNKISAMYATDTDGAALSKLSKAQLVDIATQALRMLAGECDTPLSAEDIDNDIIVSAVVDAYAHRATARAERAAAAVRAQPDWQARNIAAFKALGI